VDLFCHYVVVVCQVAVAILVMVVLVKANPSRSNDASAVSANTHTPHVTCIQHGGSSICSSGALLFERDESYGPHATTSTTKKLFR
jgi:hypothetical protein